MEESLLILIMQTSNRYQNQWTDTANLIHGRTDMQIKNHWNQTLKLKHQELKKILVENLNTFIAQDHKVMMDQDDKNDRQSQIKDVTTRITKQLKSVVESQNLQYYRTKRDTIQGIIELGQHSSNSDTSFQHDLLNRICIMHDYFTNLALKDKNFRNRKNLQFA